MIRSKKIKSGALIALSLILLLTTVSGCVPSVPPDDGYVLTWADEFDSPETLAVNWAQEAMETHAANPEVNPDSDMLRTRGAENAFVRNGELVLAGKAYRDPDNPKIKFSTPDSVTTQKTMNFRYGYLEMRANVPFTRGAWPSFWAKSDGTVYKDAGESVTRDYLAEVDVFEVFANEYGWMASNVHKWGCYGDETVNYWGLHNTVAEEKNLSEQLKYYFVSQTPGEFGFDKVQRLNTEYHLYALEWTETELIFSVDNKEYCRTGITKADDFGYRYGTGMSAFHECLYINLNNYVYSPALIQELCGGDAELAAQIQQVAGIYPDEEAAYYSEYKIDYIRLYQRPSNGKLWVR